MLLESIFVLRGNNCVSDVSHCLICLFNPLLGVETTVGLAYHAKRPAILKICEFILHLWSSE